MCSFTGRPISISSTLAFFSLLYHFDRHCGGSGIELRVILSACFLHRRDSPLFRCSSVFRASSVLDVMMISNENSLVHFRFWFPLIVSSLLIVGVVLVSTPLVPYQWQLTGNAWAVIFPLTVVCGCHILFPVSLIVFLACRDCIGQIKLFSTFGLIWAFYFPLLRHLLLRCG